MSTSQIPTSFADVGPRLHYVHADGPAYVGQPEVGLCGSIFIRLEDQDTDYPMCRECAIREVAKLRHQSTDLLHYSNELAIAVSESTR